MFEVFRRGISKAVLGGMNSASMAFSIIWYIPPFNGTLGWNSSETLRRRIMPYPGVLKNLNCFVSAYSLDVDSILAHRITGVTGNCTVTIAGTGNFFDNVNHDDIVKDDEFGWRNDPTNSTVGSIVIRTVTSELDSS